jgi:hypothetical protein
MPAAKIGGSREVLEQGRGGMPQVVNFDRPQTEFALWLSLLRFQNIRIKAGSFSADQRSAGTARRHPIEDLARRYPADQAG